MAPPVRDDDLGLAQGVEDLTVEGLVAQARIEAFDIAILPGAACFDIGSPGAAPNGVPFIAVLGQLRNDNRSEKTYSRATTFIRGSLGSG